MAWTRYAKGSHRKRPTPGQMNKLEEEYSKHLDSLILAGDVAWWSYDALNLRLAYNDKLFYKPDFMVMLKDGTLEMHECKGFWEDDALVKIKVAADKYPFVFKAIQKVPKKDGGGWSIREFGATT